MKHHVILVPGLTDNPFLSKTATKPLAKAGFSPQIFFFGWSGNFEKNLKNLVDHIQTLKKTGKVSLIGLSAGGSSVLNALLKTNEIEKVVTICSRLTMDKPMALDLIILARDKTAYNQSVESVEKNKINLKNLKTKILNISPYFDEVVPVKSQYIKGLNQKKVPFILHIPSIYFSLNYRLNYIIDFLRD